MREIKKWKSKFLVVALGQAISLLGSHGVQFALIWWLAEKTSSPLMLGISGLVAYLPMTLFSPIAGIAADRINRKFICIFSDMAMGMAATIYAVLLYFFDLPVWTVFIMLCVRGIGSTFQQPAIQSVIPQLVPENQLVKTNGWMQLMNAGSFFLGPVIGASLYAAFPMSVVLMSDFRPDADFINNNAGWSVDEQSCRRGGGRKYMVFHRGDQHACADSGRTVLL